MNESLFIKRHKELETHANTIAVVVPSAARTRDKNKSLLSVKKQMSMFPEKVCNL